jgi:hypothetical protein
MASLRNAAETRMGVVRWRVLKKYSLVFEKEPWVDQQQLTLRHAKALGCQIHVDRNAVIFGSILRGDT